jgi:hypothetical protein
VPFERRSARNARAICDRRKTGTAIAAAIAAWMIRLPEPGSMYARKGVTFLGPPACSDMQVSEDTVGTRIACSGVPCRFVSSVEKSAVGVEDLVRHVPEVV